MGLKNIPYLESAYINDSVYVNYLSKLTLLCLNLFKYENMPETCDVRMLEKALFYFGKAVFVDDENLGFLTLKVVPNGKLNVYDLPTGYEAYGKGYSKRFTQDNAVYIMNNYLEQPTLWEMQLYAKKLYDIDVTQRTNIIAQKTPVLLTCKNTQRLTLENLYMKYNGNQPFIFADKSQDLGSMIGVVKTDAPFIADKLQLLKNDVMNEALSSIGINNANTDKKERLIVDEVEANDEQIDFNLQTMLVPRQEAVEKINKKFGLNIKVSFRQEVKDEIQKIFDSLKNPENNDIIETNENLGKQGGDE